MSLVFNGNSTIDNIVFNGYDVEHLIYNGVEVWSKQTHDYSQDYFTIEALETGAISFAASDSNINMVSGNMYYSINGGAWTVFGISYLLKNNNYKIQVNTGDKVRFYGNITAVTTANSTSLYWYINGTSKFKVYGNLLSLFYGSSSEVASRTTLQRKYQVANLFNGCIGIVDASNLVFATNVYERCYYRMFYQCTNLINAPIKLQATSLSGGTYCYSYMFYGCSSLVNAPALPATTLATYCYYYMFYQTSIVNAPALPATTLANYCYANMFYGCPSLVNAPALPATTLVSNCYRNMFTMCINLKYIKAMFTTTPSTSYTNNWVQYVPESGTFVKNSAATWNVTGTSGIPSGWTVETASS